MSPQPWQEAFIGVSAVLGEPLEASLAVLGESGALRAARLVRGMRSASREGRAEAIARALAPLAVAIEEMGLQ